MKPCATRWLPGGGVLGMCLLAASAQAAGAARTHDDVHIRGAFLGGPSWFYYEAPLNTNLTHQGQSIAPALGLEVALGGTLLPGLVLGGVLTVNTQPRPNYANPEVGQGWDESSNGAGGIMAFGRWYPNPTGGFFVDVAFGPASVQARSETTIPPNPRAEILCPVVFPSCWDDNEPTKLEVKESSKLGVGLGFAAGYDFWIAEQVSLGLVARMNVAYASGSGRQYLYLAPALALEATYQ